MSGSVTNLAFWFLQNDYVTLVDSIVKCVSVQCFLANIAVGQLPIRQQNKISRVEIMPSSWWQWKDPRADWPWTEAQGRQMSFEKPLRAGSGSVSLMYISSPLHLIVYTPTFPVYTHTQPGQSRPFRPHWKSRMRTSRFAHFVSCARRGEVLLAQSPVTSAVTVPCGVVSFDSRCVISLKDAESIESGGSSERMHPHQLEKS
jgi:hypothetical protein